MQRWTIIRLSWVEVTLLTLKDNVKYSKKLEGTKLSDLRKPCPSAPLTLLLFDFTADNADENRTNIAVEVTAVHRLQCPGCHSYLI